jgi:peptidoglycan/LPS O-acetylase OafA/YrhL
MTIRAARATPRRDGRLRRPDAVRDGVPAPRLYSSVADRVFGLDLMRAVAILAVLLAHTQLLLEPIDGFRPVPLFDGVDLFFVLSGFLIGGILLRSLRRDGPGVRSLAGFWRRRWLRTLPNYYLFLALNVAFTALTFPYGLRYLDASFLVFGQTLAPFAANHGFFPEAWSLCIEEWFYLSIPLLILLLRHALPSRGVGTATAAAGLLVIVASVGARAWTFDHSLFSTYQQFDENVRKVVALRLDAPAVGLIGATLKDGFPGAWRRSRIWLTPLGLGLVPAAVAWNQHTWVAMDVTRTYVALSPTLLTFGFFCFLPVLDGWKTATGPLARFVTFTSIVSYSLYLVHYSLLIVPMQKYAPTASPSLAVLGFLAVWVLAYALAALNYQRFESRILAFRDGRVAPWPEPRAGLGT